ncbi:unnamed protein product [Alopecurus aequalis]
MASQRAKWTGKCEKGLVDVLLENKGSQYRGQNGWSSKGWNRIVRDVNKLFPDEKFTKSQIQDKEAQFKKSYKAIKSIVNRSGVSWNPISFMIDTTAEKWDEIVEEDSKLRKYQNRSSPLYDSLDQLYESNLTKLGSSPNDLAPDLDDSRLATGNKSTSSKLPGEESQETQQDPQRKDACTSIVLHNDGRDEVGGRSYGQPMTQGLHGEDLDDDEVDADLQAPRSEEPSNSTVLVASQRAKWTGKYEKGLVDVLLEYKGSQYRGQNGWCTEGWNRIVRDVNRLFPDEKFTKSQIQDKEGQFKKGYKAIKSIVNRSGVSWNPISFMINTTTEKWDVIVKEDPKLRKYENRSFPLYDSWDQLYEGQCAEGKHSFTSIRAPDLDDLRVETGSKSTSWKRPREETHQLSQRKDASTSQVLHNETFGDGRDEVGGRSYGQPMPQGLHEEDLDDDDEFDVERQAPRSEEPSNSRSADCGTNGRPKKRKDGSIPRLDETISAYIDLKIAQTSSKEQAMQQGYSISRCFEVLHSMDDVSDDIIVLASDVFKDPVNREIFMCYQPRFRGLWLRKEVAKLDVPGFCLR